MIGTSSKNELNLAPLLHGSVPSSLFRALTLRSLDTSTVTLACANPGTVTHMAEQSAVGYLYQQMLLPPAWDAPKYLNLADPRSSTLLLD